MEKASQQKFRKKFETVGPEEFYTLLCDYAKAKIEEIEKNSSLEENISPEAELLNLSNQFWQIYKREEKNIYKEISYVFKRAANKTYRMLLRKKMIKKSNKFLNLVQ